MKFPGLTVLFLLFVIWLQYEIRKSSRQAKKASELFWDREQNANLARRGDLSTLEYITLNLDRLPMEDVEDMTSNSYRDTIKSLADKKMVNLSGLTNTELKYRFGAGSLKELSEYDSNYTVLVSILHKWAERLYHQNLKDKARMVLEYAVSIHTDVTKSYQLLATLYKEANQVYLIDGLIEIIPTAKIVDSKKLIDELQKTKFF